MATTKAANIIQSIIGVVLQTFREAFEKQIAQLGDVMLSTQELGTTGQLIHMLTDGKIPNPQ